MTDSELLRELEEILKQFPPEIPVDGDYSDERYDKYDIAKQPKDDTYCHCLSPNTYMNSAGGNKFLFCKTCRKEKL